MTEENIIQLPVSEGVPVKTLAVLEERHRKLYQEFLPTLEGYQRMAKEALELQVEITALKLANAFPDAESRNWDVVMSISAREMPSRVEELVAEVQRQGVKVTAVTYDARTFSFVLFSNGSQ